MSSANRLASHGARFKVSHSSSLKDTTDFTKSALYKTDNDVDNMFCSNLLSDAPRNTLFILLCIFCLGLIAVTLVIPINNLLYV